jgi:aminoglycoside 6'-N-acetyltransferase I
MAAIAAEPQRYAAFVAYTSERQPAAFAEAALRRDYVNGAQSSPVVFLEGLYVVPALRRRGLARALVEEVCRWGRSLGCAEVASDALLENSVSHAVHRALGFAETERVVFYRKPLA